MDSTPIFECVSVSLSKEYCHLLYEPNVRDLLERLKVDVDLSLAADNKMIIKGTWAKLVIIHEMLTSYSLEKIQVNQTLTPDMIGDGKDSFVDKSAEAHPNAKDLCIDKPVKPVSNLNSDQLCIGQTMKPESHLNSGELLFDQAVEPESRFCVEKVTVLADQTTETEMLVDSEQFRVDHTVEIESVVDCQHLHADQTMGHDVSVGYEERRCDETAGDVVIIDNKSHMGQTVELAVIDTEVVKKYEIVKVKVENIDSDTEFGADDEIYINITMDSDNEKFINTIHLAGMDCQSLTNQRADSNVKDTVATQGTSDPGIKLIIKVEAGSTTESVSGGDMDGSAPAGLQAKRVQTNYRKKPPNRFFCSSCSFKTNRESHYTRHIKLHTVDNCKLFRCGDCSFVTCRANWLCRHQMTQHNKATLSCHLCSFQTIHNTHLKWHFRRKHPPNKPVLPELQCEECSYKTPSQRMMQRHMQGHERHKERQQNRRIFKCSLCDYGTVLRTNLQRHIQTVHRSTSAHLCHICGKGFKRKDSLKVHTLTHSQPSPQFACEVCGKCNHNYAKLKAHMNSTHSRARLFLCEVCGSAFKNAAAQRKHTVNVHERLRSFTCNECTRRFSTKFSLNRHMKLHKVDRSQPTESANEPVPVAKSQPIPAENRQHQPVATEHNASIVVHHASPSASRQCDSQTPLAIMVAFQNDEKQQDIPSPGGNRGRLLLPGILLMTDNSATLTNNCGFDVQSNATTGAEPLAGDTRSDVVSIPHLKPA